MELSETIAAVFLKSQLAEGMTEMAARKFLSSSRVRFVHCRKGDIVFRDGDNPECLYVLLKGKVLIQKESFTGRHIFLSAIDECGDVFGEVYLLMGRPYDMYVEAAQDTELLAIRSESFSLEGKTEGDPDLVVQRNLMRILARKAYFMHSKLKIMASGSIRERILRFLFWNLDEQGEVRLNFSRESWADYLAAARPSLSRELSALQQEGILQVDGRRIRIADKEKFESYL